MKVPEQIKSAAKVLSTFTAMPLTTSVSTRAKTLFCSVSQRTPIRASLTSTFSKTIKPPK